MKIALCFYGQPRCIDSQTYCSVKDKLFPNNEVDVYAHFWFPDDPSVLCETSFFGSAPFNSDAIRVFTETYSPINVTTEVPLTHDIITHPYNEPYTNAAYHTISRFTSVQKVLTNIQDPSQYTFIVLLRSDLIIDVSPDLSTLDTTKLHLTALGGCEESNYQPQLIIFPPSFIPSFTGIISNIESWTADGFVVDSFQVIKKVVSENKDNVAVLPFESYRNSIKRSDGNIHVCRDQY